MMDLFDKEQIMRTYWRDVARSITEAITETVTETVTEAVTKAVREAIVYETSKEIAERMIKMGKLSLEEIASYVPVLSMDELKELEAALNRR